MAAGLQQGRQQCEGTRQFHWAVPADTEASELLRGLCGLSTIVILFGHRMCLLAWSSATYCIQSKRPGIFVRSAGRKFAKIDLASRTKPGLHGKEGKVKGGIPNGGKCKCGALCCKLQLQFDLHAHITKGEGFINKATHFCLDKDVRDSQLNFEIFRQHGDNNGFHFASVRCTHVKFLR